MTIPRGFHAACFAGMWGARWCSRLARMRRAPGAVVRCGGALAAYAALWALRAGES